MARSGKSRSKGRKSKKAGRAKPSRSKSRRSKYNRKPRRQNKKPRKAKAKKRAYASKKTAYLCASFMTGPNICVPNTRDGVDRIFAEAARRGDEFGLPLATWTSKTNGEKDRRWFPEGDR